MPCSSWLRDSVTSICIFSTLASRCRDCNPCPSLALSWAEDHAAVVSQWPKSLVTISDSRTSQINFVALQHAIEAAMGQACTSIEWVSEGGSNQLYLASLADGLDILARIAFPFPHRVRTGDAFQYQEDHDRARLPYRLQSELWTIRYVQNHTKNPVPKVYAHDSSLKNAVGSPYMLQEVVGMPATTTLIAFPQSISAKIKGAILAECWNDMNIEQRSTVVKSLGAIVGSLMTIKFNRYGSLKPAADMTRDILGPLVEPIRTLFRDYVLTEAGPWPASEPSAPFLALAIRELHWLTSAPGRQLFWEWRGSSYPQEDREKTLPAFLELARTLIQVIPHLYSLFPLPEEACRPALSHADFHYSNILVSHRDPTIITGVIDWEFAATLPLCAIVVQPQVEQIKQSICGLHTLVNIATSGVALNKSCGQVMALLVELRHFVYVDNVPGVEQLDNLIGQYHKLCE